MRFNPTAYSCVLVVGLAVHSHVAIAAKPTRDVLPGSTKFSYSVANQQAYARSWKTTGIGQFLLDSGLEPFWNDLPRQLRDEARDHPLSRLQIDPGIELSDLEELGAGEAVWALVHPEGGLPSRVLITEVADRDTQVEALLEKVSESMNSLDAERSTLEVAGTSVTVYDIPESAELGARKLYHCQVEDQLVFAEDQAIVKLLLENLSAEATDTLANQPGYQQVMNQLQERAGDQAADGILYLIPVDLSEALRELSPREEERVDEGLSVARKHNFDAISAVGAYVSLATDPFDIHMRMAVHAPKPWTNGVRILSFPNQPLTVFPWVRSDCDGYTLLNVNFDDFSKFIGPLFDDVYGEGEEGLYDDLKYTLKDDPDGPQVDVDKELFGQLAPQVTLLTRDQLPVTPDSPQRLIALKTTDETALAAMVKKVLETDPNTEAGTIAGQPAYFSYMEEESDDFGFSSSERSDDQAPSFITCVARGHLFFATDKKILEDTLSAAETDAMTGDKDHEKLATHFERFGEDICLQFFGRISDMVRVGYELAREGKQPNAAKSFGGLINNIALGEPPEIDPPNLDGSKLPPFDQLQHDLGLVGVVGMATDDGWYLEGFVLKRD